MVSELNPDRRNTSNMSKNLTPAGESLRAMFVAKTAADREMEDARRHAAEVFRLLKEGGTTGSSVDDLAFRLHVMDFLPFSALYSSINKTLMAHIGQPVMVVSTIEVRTRFGGPGTDCGYQHFEVYALGIISGELVLRDVSGQEKLCINTGGHCLVEDVTSRRRIPAVEQIDLPTGPDDYEGHRVPLLEGMELPCEYSGRTSIMLIGEASITGWLTKRGSGRQKPTLPELLAALQSAAAPRE